MAFANGKGGELYAEYQAAAEGAERRRFRRPAARSACVSSRSNPDVLKDYQRRFKYMLVDEYQDTNVAQYLWLRLLAQGHSNICCVGDDDQSIYGWRGAEVDNILRFEKDFPGAKVIRLERNYRSTPHILGAASGLIAKNEGRLGKTLQHRARRRRADHACAAIGTAMRKPAPSAMTSRACSARARSSTTWRSWCAPPSRCAPSKTASSRSACPIGSSAARASMSAQEIRDALAYFKVTASPDNDLAFERIINVPKRGIGDTSVKRCMSMRARTASRSIAPPRR